jgi:hypothetical protein
MFQYLQLIWGFASINNEWKFRNYTPGPASVFCHSDPYDVLALQLSFLKNLQCCELPAVDLLYDDDNPWEESVFPENFATIQSVLKRQLQHPLEFAVCEPLVKVSQTPLFGELTCLPKDLRVYFLERVDNFFYLFAFGKYSKQFQRWMKDNDVFGRWFRRRLNIPRESIDEFVSNVIRGTSIHCENAPDYGTSVEDHEFEHVGVSFDWHKNLIVFQLCSDIDWNDEKVTRALQRVFTKYEMKAFVDTPCYREVHVAYDPHLLMFQHLHLVWEMSCLTGFWKYENRKEGVSFKHTDGLDVLSLHINFLAQLNAHDFPYARGIYAYGVNQDEDDEAWCDSDFPNAYVDIQRTLKGGLIHPLKLAHYGIISFSGNPMLSNL